MKNRTKTLSLLPLFFSLPMFMAHANDESVTKEELQKELDVIQHRLASLEGDDKVSSEASDTSINFYGSLRPTFGVTMTDSEDVWDVGDALSRIGIYSEHKVNDSLVAFARGEFKVNIQANGDFGEARKAYVGVKGNFGRVAIGKQSTTQYLMIADPVDIFNRAATPLAYDSASPFRINNLVTYRKSVGDLSFSVDSQFDGSRPDDASDFFNTGLEYNTDFIRAAVAYYSKDLNDGSEEQTYGASLAKSFGPLYVAAAYQDRDVSNVSGSTLDVVAAYAITNIYKLKVGVSAFDDGLSESTSGDYTAYNTTLEWQGIPEFRLFIEYQKTAFDYSADNDQVTVGMRYDFDYAF